MSITIPRLNIVALAVALSFGSIANAVSDDSILTLALAGGANAELSLADLDALPQSQFSTSTIWTKGTVLFQGVLLGDLLAAYDLNPASVEAIALNDYAITLPVAEVVADGALLATRMDGVEMTIREKGPVWIVFPFDSDPAMRSEVVYSRSIWQLATIRPQPAE